MSWLDEDSEATHLAEIQDGDIDEPREEWNEDWDDDEDDWFESERAERFKEKIADSIEANEKHYKKNKAAKIGTTITCAGPLCNKKIVKKQYTQCFCSNHCKDQFWNRREAHFGFRKKIDN